MLTTLANGIVSGIVGQGPIANAVLESFLIHVRALMDFLYSDAPQSDDVVAEDYFANPDDWKKARPPLSDILIHARRRTGKHVAHLTYARLGLKPETKQWPFVEIANEISTVLNVFLDNVPKGNLGAQWENT